MPTLRQLHKLPEAARVRRIRADGTELLEDGVESALREGLRDPWITPASLATGFARRTGAYYKCRKLGPRIRLAAALRKIKLSALTWMLACEEDGSCVDRDVSGARPAGHCKSNFEALYGRCNPGLIAAIRSWRIPPEKAEETANWCWLELHKRHLRAGATPYLALAEVPTWLYLVAWRSLFRRRGPDPDPLPAEPELPGGSPAWEALQWELRRELLKCLENLSPEEALVVVAVFVYSIPQQDIAKRLGLSEPRIHQIKTAALNKLRNCLRKKGFEMPDLDPR